MKHFIIFGLLVSLVLFTTHVYASNKIAVVTYGGSWGKAQQRAMFDPFTDKTGIELNIIPNSDYALGILRAQVESGNVIWDVINLRPEAIAVACEDGLLENFNIDDVLSSSPDGTPASKDFFSGFIVPCGAPQILYSIQFAYNTDKYGNNPPQTIADVFDIVRFPGKRGLQNKPYNNLEWALIADGVHRNNVRNILATDAGLNRAFAMMDKIKDDIIWWTKAAIGIQHIASGEVDIAANYNGRFWTASEIEGLRITPIWDHQIYTVTNWVVPTGKLTSSVRKFLKFTTSPQILADISRIITYGPARQSSVKINENNWTNVDTGVDMISAMPTNADNMKTAFGRDGVWWAEHGDKIAERWELWRQN